MQIMDPQTILLSVGDYGFDGVASIEAVSQDRSTSYGKTITIAIADGRSELFTIGHRNPQGLYIDHAGNIWSTEHGPQGGDKLNRLIRGANYGWPYATFGTDYGSFNWPLNKPEWNGAIIRSRYLPGFPQSRARILWSWSRGCSRGGEATY